jgi:hypothetical protein
MVLEHESGRFGTARQLPGRPTARVEHLISSVQTPNENAEIADVDSYPRAATGGQTVHLRVPHQPFDGLVVKVATPEASNLILDKTRRSWQPPISLRAWLTSERDRAGSSSQRRNVRGKTVRLPSAPLSAIRVARSPADAAEWSLARAGTRSRKRWLRIRSDTDAPGIRSAVRLARSARSHSDGT